MTGFCAIFDEQDRGEVSRQVDQMASVLSGRGRQTSIPSLIQGFAAVGLSRSRSGNTVDSFQGEAHAAVVDGQVFNLSALRRATDATDSDGMAQVILRGYELYGESWFNRIDGNFAAMIVDSSSGAVVVARDRFGARPMYFGIDRGRVYVASEIKSILQVPGFVTSVNEPNLRSAIAFGFTSGPQTLFRNIYKCVPGFVFSIRADGTFQSTDYLTLSASTRSDLTIEDASALISQLLKDSLARHLDGVDSPGVLLSGGVDSALMAYETRRMPKDVIAISSSAELWDGDESLQAENVANEIGIPFIRSFIPLEEDFPAVIRQVVRALEEPTRFENAVTMLSLARDAASHCDVIMNGETADLILGLRGHVTASRVGKAVEMPAIMRYFLRALPLRRAPLRHLRLAGYYAHWDSVRDMYVSGLANCGDLVAASEDALLETEIGEMANDYSQILSPGAQYTMANIREASHSYFERMEKISAAFGLECMQPFACNGILQLGMELPQQVLYSNRISKPAVRKLAEQVFGAEMAYRPKRQFAAPMQLWLDRSDRLRTEVLSLRDSNSRIREFLDNKAVNLYLDRYERQGASDNKTAVHVFRMLTFEYWLNEFFA